jgi:hypothetical protein
MAEEKLKYLEFLQAAITRMGSNSFLVKGWSVTLGTAVLGFFWILDAYYRALEKLFRDLWERAVASEKVTFNMRPGTLCRALIGCNKSGTTSPKFAPGSSNGTTGTLASKSTSICSLQPGSERPSVLEM